MNRLTPLERELLSSVRDLLNGTEQEISALEGSLRDYDADSKAIIDQRLSVIASTQTSLQKRLSEIEAKTSQLERQFSNVLGALETRLNSYEDSMKSLNGMLERLMK